MEAEARIVAKLAAVARLQKAFLMAKEPPKRAEVLGSIVFVRSERESAGNLCGRAL